MAKFRSPISVPNLLLVKGATLKCLPVGSKGNSTGMREIKTVSNGTRHKVAGTQQEKPMKRQRALWVVMALMPLLASCATSGRLAREPIFMPFSACQKAAILALDFEATEENVYTFLLTLQWSEDDVAERKRVAKYVGDGGYDPKTNKQINTGLPIPLRLKISRLDPTGEISIYEKAICEEELHSRGPKEIEKVIDRIKLPQGNYRVHAEALADIPDLVGTPIGLGIYVHRPSVDLRPWKWRFPSQQWVFPEGRVKCAQR